MSYDVAAVRRLSPAVERMTYLDAGFQSPLSVRAKERLEAFIAWFFDTAGPKSEWLAGMEAVRGQTAAFVNAAREVIAALRRRRPSPPTPCRWPPGTRC
ncbi:MULTISPECIES: hypothetical protein [Paracoccus]|uniref:hypothetical protein n=1 Tax=Paracoccus TaxID=265 RepID=UPI001FB6D6BC|nr:MULTISPECIES: hypothetical protein [Paracoccus]MCJ1902054.1 hypothetical protein [Paracoccus versutus]MDF3906519.1 hypothetical protein [Paracoccus sp. AS002]